MQLIQRVGIWEGVNLMDEPDLKLPLKVTAVLAATAVDLDKICCRC